MSAHYFKIVFLAVLLAFTVVVLGAYTRLSNAGLGCPDWPFCYGHVGVPNTVQTLQKAEADFPGQTVEAPKAWKEMIHRYCAGALALLIVILAVWAIKLRVIHIKQPIALPIVLLLLVIFQAALGMWTVTWKVWPLVVSTHLLCGFTLTALLWYLMLTTRPTALASAPLTQALGFKAWIVMGLVILIVQISLGAWTSTTYSALACKDFPFCQGTLWPALELQQAFDLFRPVGVNYEGGVLETPIRITIQMVHRYGAFITGCYLYFISLWIIFSNKTAGIRGIAGLLILFLTIQILLGIGNVLLGLPMWTAVLHNGVALLLLLTLVTLLFRVRR